MLAIRMYFWDDWPPKPTPTGQSPPGMKYAAKYKQSYVYRSFLLIGAITWALSTLQ